MHRMIGLGCYIRQQHAFFRHGWPNMLLHIFVTSTWRWAIRTFETLHRNFLPTWHVNTIQMCMFYSWCGVTTQGFLKHFTETKLWEFCRLKSVISLDYNNCRTHSAQTLKFHARFVTATLATPIQNKPIQLHSVQLLLHATGPETICSHLIQALAKVLNGQLHCANGPENSSHWQGRR